MPLITVALTRKTGALVRVQITLGQPDLFRRRQARQPIPAPVVVHALLDTGAERTCVDPAVVRQLSLPVCGSGLTAAPGVGIGPPALGGTIPVFSYEAGLSVLHPSNKRAHNLVVAQLVVEELPLAGLGYDAIIGRDVLASCVLVYDGPAGSFTLAY